MKHWIACLLLLACVGWLGAQAPKHLFVKDHITLAVGGMWREPGYATPFDPYTLSDPRIIGRSGLGIRPTMTYTLNLGKRVGFETGFMPCIFWERYKFGFPGPVDSGGYPTSRKSYMLEIPLRAFCRVRMGERMWLQPFLGISLIAYQRREIRFTYGLYGENWNDLRYYGEFVTTNGVEAWQYLHGNVGAALLLRLPNEDMLRVSVATNLVADGKNFITSSGEYGIVDGQGNIIGQGFFDTRGNHVMLDIGYTFTRTRELRRQLEATAE